MSNVIELTPLGGLGEFGSNCLAVRYGEDMILVDVGMGFPEESAYGVDVEVPDFDFVARFGGEEFSILVPGVHSQTSLLHTGDRIRRTLERLTVAVTGDRGDPAVVGVTASVGAAMFPDHALNLADLLRAADTALYAAKRGGRNRTCLAGEPLRRPA